MRAFGQCYKREITTNSPFYHFYNYALFNRNDLKKRYLFNYKDNLDNELLVLVEKLCFKRFVSCRMVFEQVACCSHIK